MNLDKWCISAMISKVNEVIKLFATSPEASKHKDQHCAETRNARAEEGRTRILELRAAENV